MLSLNGAPSQASHHNSSGNQRTPGSSSGNGNPQAKHFKDVYKLGAVLGKGAFSEVKEGSNKQGESFAIKIVTKSKLTAEDEAALKDEISILKNLNHKHIIRLYEVYYEDRYYYLVTERMMGGELFDRIVAKAYYNEKEARDTCRIIFEAMSYIHHKQIAHRDLKPENLLLMSDQSDSEIKLADFGFAKIAKDESCLTTQCGTPGYVAPEILEGTPYGTKADMWSLGVIVYILLGGYPPFIEENQRDLFRKIRKGQYEFHEEYWSGVSREAKGLIRSLLTVDPKKRISADEALRNKWMVGDDAALEACDLGGTLTELRKFNAKRKFKAAAMAVIAKNKITSLGKNFHENLE